MQKESKSNELSRTREINFSDEHNLVLVTTVVEPIKNPETGELLGGSVEKKIIEPKKVSEIREQQARNVVILEDIREELGELLNVNMQRPEPLPSRLAQLAKDIETVSAYNAKINAIAAHDKKLESKKDAEQRALKVIDTCSAILAKRRELYPEASVEPIDTVTV